MSPDGMVQAANASARRILRARPGQLVSRSRLDPIQRVMGEHGKEIGSATIPSGLMLRTGEPILSRVYGLLSKTSELMWVW